MNQPESEVGICAICGREAFETYDYLANRYCARELSICSDCAECVANIYNFAHCGEFITWEQPATASADNERRGASISFGIRKAVFERDMYRCQHCGSWLDLSIDHIVPVSAGGGSELENLQTLCLTCNSRKGAK